VFSAENGRPEGRAAGDQFKTRKRTRVTKFQENIALHAYFARAETAIEIRDRAMFGFMWCTGCRPNEATTALLNAITPYGEMGCWNKGQTKNGQEYEVPVPSQSMS
jgi:integrase